MDAVAAAMLTKSLDALSLRLEVTATNIANANSPGYRPSRVAFEDSLRLAAGRGANAVAGVTPRIEPVPAGRFGDEPRTDLDLNTAVETAGRYAALTAILGHELDLTRTAIKGGQS